MAPSVSTLCRIIGSFFCFAVVSACGGDSVKLNRVSRATLAFSFSESVLRLFRTGLDVSHMADSVEDCTLNVDQ